MRLPALACLLLTIGTAVARADDATAVMPGPVPATAAADPQPAGVAPSQTPAGRPKQILMISFDGAGPNPLWQKSHDIARANDAHFTYFFSCAFLIPRADAKTYTGPHQKPGKSNVGFGKDQAEVRERLGHIWQAHLDGDEIASHTCGHFNGKDWTAEDWLTEMHTFRHVVANAWTSVGAGAEEPKGWQDFVKNDIRGFRAPYFSVSAGLLQAEHEAGFVFDASGVENSPVWPKETDGVLRFGLPLIPEGPGQRPIIAMDYNLFFRHSHAVETPDQTKQFEDRAYSAFKAAFDKQYDGDRLPVQIGLHFVEMNGGAYWRAMEHLVGDVCHRQDVACVTYSEAIAMMKERHAAQHSGL